MLYQKSVLNKYLNEQNEDAVHSAYQTYKAYFHNTTIQQNIINSKEEQFQEGFLRELFVAVFGYVLNPQPDFNLTTEFKNEKGSKKADGAILKDGKAVAVIELKSTKTKDLESIRQQAFDYKANQSSCVYVITSNFQKLRFYINNAVEFEEFDLFTLTEEQFKLLFLCLNSENLLSDLPLKVKDASILEEETITKKFYDDYSNFKKDLFESIAKLNENLENVTKLQLYKKTQKLLDRFLFIFFAEDRGLLPPNSISRMIKRWNLLKDEDAYKPLYDIYKQYFGYLNKGRKGKVPADDIHEYNGGLFLPDEILANIKIDDDVLLKHTSILTNYDFESQVDVNILGHILEHSLNEIESTTAKLEGVDFDKQKSKRKKDGVFYTPKYITKYIVDNTVGKLCEEKKTELGITDGNFTQNRKKNTKRKLLASLESYRSWLLELTICDPACGSGAFLNQALEYLINEHHYIDGLNAQLFGSTMVFQDVENQILEKNIFGVDINEESVDIARLSLWLRTAQRGRKLTTLNKNIKWGNSLIDDPEVAGEKAFNWEKEFPEVFAKGGFDVVIGNPPYVNANDLKRNSTISEYKFLKNNYKTAKGTVDLYIYFFEKGLKIINHNGLLSYITPNRYLSASYGKALREFFLEKCEIVSLVDYSDKKVFVDASTYPVISFLKIKSKENYFVLTGKFDDVTKIFVGRKFPSLKLNLLQESILGFLLNDKLEISEKIINQSCSLEESGKINATSTASEADQYSELICGNGYKLINTGTIDPYITTWGVDKLINKGKKYLTPFLPKNHDAISKNRQALYSSPKIIVSKIGLRCEAFYDRDGIYSSINTNCIHSFSKDFRPEYIMCWLNSKLYEYLYECLFDGLRMAGGYLLFSSPNLRNTYIKRISTTMQKSFIEKAESRIKIHDRLVSVIIPFVQLIKTKFDIIEPSNKLRNWYKLEFNDILKELKKVKVKLSLSEEAEWMGYFNEQKQKAQAIKSEIDRTDKEIDQMVYELYGLTEDEIKIVEES